MQQDLEEFSGILREEVHAAGTDTKSMKWGGRMTAYQDFLDRTPDLETLEMIVNGLSRSRRGCTFAINGSWGSGKSFLLQMLQDKLAAEQAEETADDRYLIVRYDCWQYDYYEEPVIAILAAILENVTDKNKCAVVCGAWEQLKKVGEKYAGKFLENQLGVDPVKVYKECKDAGQQQIDKGSQYDSYYMFKKTLDELRRELKKIAESKTIVFIVDELDRCLPEYAITVLERLHHIFSGIDNIVTILAIDRNGIEQVVKQTYGEHINTEGYLKKIIDFYFQLDMGRLSEHYMEKYESYAKKFTGKKEEYEWTQKLVRQLMRGLDIRTQEKLFSRAELIHDMILEKDEAMDYSCMAFELLNLTTRLWKKRQGKEEIPWYHDLSNVYSDRDDSAELLNMLRSVVNDRNLTATIVSGEKTHFVLEERLSHLLRWYMEHLHTGGKEGLCGRYAIDAWKAHDAETAKMQLFDRLADVIE